MKPKQLKRDSPVGTEFTIGRLRVNDFKQALIKLLARYRQLPDGLITPVETSFILDFYRGQKEATIGFIMPLTWELIYCFEDFDNSDDIEVLIGRKDAYQILKLLKTLPLFDSWVELRKATWSITVWFDKDEYYNFEAVRAGTNRIRKATHKYFNIPELTSDVKSFEEVDTVAANKEIF